MKSRLSMNSCMLTALTGVSLLWMSCNNVPFLEPISSSLTTRDVQIERSLMVTNLAILDSRFSLERVLNQYVAQSGSSSVTARDLYRQWWDTQNDADRAVTSGPHCDDEVDFQGRPAINGHAIQCPRQEGELAIRNPFGSRADSNFPIALVNRFDLAPEDGSNCGEHRIIYGKEPRLFIGALDRNLIIIESVLPNPNPEQGLAGCRPVAEFWASLSDIDDVSVRAQQLSNFFFDGLPGFAPVIHKDHVAPGTGQIRSNQFMPGRRYLGGAPRFQPWQLREFKLDEVNGRLTMLPVRVRQSPFAPLFDDSTFNPQGPAFRAEFISQVENLAINDLNRFFMDTSETFDGGQSTSQFNESDYVAACEAGNGDFRNEIQAELDRIGSDLTPDHIVRRALATSCAGCHQLNNGPFNPSQNLGGGLTWPNSLTFVHVSEENQVRCNPSSEGMCWQRSPALINVFLPARESILEGFLTFGALTEDRPKGLRVH